MKWIAPVLCIAFAMRMSGQTYTDHPNGDSSLIPTVQSKLPKALPAVVITSDYYPQPKALVLHALNNSGKDITGYTIIIRHKNPDRTLKKSGGWDREFQQHQIKSEWQSKARVAHPL
jgi:hypothetical protein